MHKPLRVFIASSSEQIDTAWIIANALDDKPHVSAHVWEEDTFDFSASYIESLEKELEKADFAVVVLTADDVANVRKRDVNLPRDNVIFELGLFIGRLGRSRAFFFVDGDSDTTIASDLSGVKPVKYHEKSDSDDRKRKTLSTQVEKVRKQMLKLGARYKPSPEVREHQDGLWQFCSRIAGHWWERMRQGEDDKSALSYVTIMVDTTTNNPRLGGQAYDLDGERLANWKSIISGSRYDGQWQVFYRWEGEHDAQTGQVYGGGGSFKFDDEMLQTARGYFYDTNFAKLPDIATTRIKRFGLYRCDPKEIDIMKKPWSEQAKALIKKKLTELSGR